MRTEPPLKASADVYAPVIEAPRISWLERFATAEIIHWRARRAIEIAAIIALAGMFGLTLWLMRDSFVTPPSHSYSKEELSIVELAKIASGTGVAAPDRTVLPKIQPVAYIKVPEELARRVNELVPFSTAPNIPARPFLFAGTPEQQERALTCLAMAGYYEAGDDPVGQSAVVQVVLNRLRHPAFPKSVCGVVLQGATRSTGCQFTFACDGSMARRAPSPEALARARASAARALTGAVFSVVGEATHYHTDFVLPRWSGQMDKITAFHGHLFFRWRGSWGYPAAFRSSYVGPETLDARFARFASPVASSNTIVERDGIVPALPSKISEVQPMVNVAGMGAVEASGGIVHSDDLHHIYYVYFGSDDYPGTYAITAWKICAGKSPCTVYGWRTSRDIPALVSPARPGKISFAFSKHEAGTQQSLWNCAEIVRGNKDQCLPGTATPASSVP